MQSHSLGSQALSLAPSPPRQVFTMLSKACTQPEVPVWAVARLARVERVSVRRVWARIVVVPRCGLGSLESGGLWVVVVWGEMLW